MLASLAHGRTLRPPGPGRHEPSAAVAGRLSAGARQGQYVQPAHAERQPRGVSGRVPRRSDARQKKFEQGLDGAGNSDY